MPEAIFAYYPSPWEPGMVGMLCLWIIGLLYACIKFKSILQERGLVGFSIGIATILLFIGIMIFVVADRANPKRNPWIAIYTDHMTCGSWHRDGKYLRPPWKAFTRIEKVVGVHHFWEVRLQFHFKPEYADMLQATDVVRENGWLYCQIGALTDSAGSLAWPTDTDEIYNKVVGAWRADIGSVWPKPK